MNKRKQQRADNRFRGATLQPEKSKKKVSKPLVFVQSKKRESV